MKRKICIVTGTRAEYGLLRLLMRRISQDPDLLLQIVVTGTHLSPEFGSTYREIENDAFLIDKKVEMLLSSDSQSSISKAVGLGVIGFSDAFNDLSPHMLLILGDRYEILAAATAALLARIPIAHVHGGEVTTGSIDDSMRHAITKMSHLHFVSTPAYQRRVIQLGESPDRVHCVGGLGVDAIAHLDLLTRPALEAALQFSMRRRNLLVTFHPATADTESPASQMKELLAALGEFHEIGLIFTFPNADAGGRELIGLIEGFVAEHANAKAFPSLGQMRYFSCMRHFDGVVGNSSSGILEAPSFKIGTVNIGSRQMGRIQASSVINCEPRREPILHSIEELLSPEFRARVSEVVSPYGNGGATERISKLLKVAELDQLSTKNFFDLPMREFEVST